jgi:hypothetical protein
MLHFDKYLFSDLEVWSLSTVLVGGYLVTFLHSRCGVSEVLIKLIKVGDKVVSAGGS